MTSPTVSIGLAVYNGENGIGQALDTILAQDFTDFELLISDNASTDATREICRNYMLKDRRIQYSRTMTNIGAVANFNRVFAAAEGEYFMWAGHDDYRRPWFISSCLRELRRSDRVVLAGTDCDYVDKEERLILVDHSLCTTGMTPLQRFKRYKELLHAYDRHRGGIFYGLFRTSALRKVMPLRNAMTADQDMMLKLSLLGEFVTVPERLLTRHAGGASRGLRSLARAYGISSPLTMYGVYFTREYEIAKMVSQSHELTSTEKLQLLAWSPLHTLRAVGGRVLSLGMQRLSRDKVAA